MDHRRDLQTLDRRAYFRSEPAQRPDNQLAKHNCLPYTQEHFISGHVDSDSYTSQGNLICLAPVI